MLLIIKVVNKVGKISYNEVILIFLVFNFVINDGCFINFIKKVNIINLFIINNLFIICFSFFLFIGVSIVL